MRIWLHRPRVFRSRQTIFNLGVAGVFSAHCLFHQCINHRASYSFCIFARSENGPVFRHAIIWRIDRHAPLPWRDSLSYRIANASMLHAIILDLNCRFDKRMSDQLPFDDRQGLPGSIDEAGLIGGRRKIGPSPIRTPLGRFAECRCASSASTKNAVAKIWGRPSITNTAAMSPEPFKDIWR
jgi:hypothetical protein